MVFDRLRRRTFLGGVAGGMVGLAGCESDDPKTRTEDTSDPTDVTDTGSTADQADASIPPHDHSGPGSGGAVLAPQKLSVEESQRAPSYVIYKRDGAYRALDGETGTESFSHGEAAVVIQRAINDIDGGTVFLKRGEYPIGTREIHLRSNVRLVGEGRGATVLRLKDGVNGRRGQRRASILVVGPAVENVTIANLEIDGNESNNRGVPPYPLSPHHHGILIHGSGPQVPEERKPSNVTVRNVSVHDTVRSNVVLAGRNCELQNLWLSNSATDHWLYMGGATNCTVRGVHASGFARAEGIVLGVGDRRVSGNVITDLKISNITETPYQNDEPNGIGGRYPIRSVIFRPSEGSVSGENKRDNTLQNVVISLPEAGLGQYIAVNQPNTRIQNLTYRGPIGEHGVVNAGKHSNGFTFQDSTIELDGSTGKPTPVVSASRHDTRIEGVHVRDPKGGDRSAVYIVNDDNPLERVTLRDITVETNGTALDVRTAHEIRNLYVANFQDVTQLCTLK